MVANLTCTCLYPCGALLVGTLARISRFFALTYPMSDERREQNAQLPLRKRPTVDRISPGPTGHRPSPVRICPYLGNVESRCCTPTRQRACQSGSKARAAYHSAPSCTAARTRPGNSSMLILPKPQRHISQ